MTTSRRQELPSGAVQPSTPGEMSRSAATTTGRRMISQLWGEDW